MWAYVVFFSFIFTGRFSINIPLSSRACYMYRQAYLALVCIPNINE